MFLKEIKFIRDPLYNRNKGKPIMCGTKVHPIKEMKFIRDPLYNRNKEKPIMCGT